MTIDRNKNIDILRGLGVLLVVAGHNWAILPERDLAFRVIFVFHMPLFFYISGVFLKADENIGNCATSKFDSILKPYLSVSIIASIIYCLMKATFTWDLLLGIAYGNGNTLVWTWLWFLPCLFITSLLALICTKISGNNHRYKFLIALGLLLISMQASPLVAQMQLPEFQLAPEKAVNAIGLPFNLDLIPVSVAFMLFGHLTPISFFHKTSSITVVLVAILTLSWIHFSIEPTLDMNLRISTSPFALYSATAISIFLLIEFGKRLALITSASLLISKFGRASLFIYLFHFPAQALVTFKLLKIFPNLPMLGYLAGFISGVIVPYFIFLSRNRIGFISTLLLPSKARLRQGT